MKTLYIGDIHGDIGTVRKIRDTYSEDYRKIFTGDLVDVKFLSTTPEEQFQCVETMLEMIQKDGGNTICLVGNHEVSYLLPDDFPCSGYTSELDALLENVRGDIWKNFKGFTYDKDRRILATHAGLTRRLWEDGGFTLDNVEEKLSAWYAPPYDSRFFGAGRARGGMNPVGGPVWCDYDMEFTPIEGLTQVFGHTPDMSRRTKGVRIKGDNYNIDCTRYGKILLEEDGKFTEINIGDK